MLTVSVIMPVYNVEAYVADAIQSVLNQSWGDFELLIIDDGGTDRSMEICQQFDDPRIQIIHQANRGLAGARNTGIRHARGEFLAFLDSDDLWDPEKLARHVIHLSNSPAVGVSYSASELIDDHGKSLRLYQSPKLTDINVMDVICRNPIGNGSAPVIRREVFNDIAFQQHLRDDNEYSWFDETFRQSEDIECWTRIAALTAWKFEGLSEPLTLYRVNEGGLSANLEKQLASWERMMEKVQSYAPTLAKRYGSCARAYQLRYLARRAVRMRAPWAAFRLAHYALAVAPSILWKEPAKTLTTLASAWLLTLTPRWLYDLIEQRAIRVAAGHH